MAFEKTVPVWNAEGSEPPETLKNSGFTAGYKPPAGYFNWFWHSVSECLKELQEKGMSADDTDALIEALSDKFLQLTGGTLSGALTVMENFNVNKTYDDVEYKTYVRPLNYALGEEYTTGLLHFIGGVNNSQLLFNRNGVAFRDNVAGKLYQLFGQHNAATAAASIRSQLYTYGTDDMTAGTSELATGKMYLVYE